MFYIILFSGDPWFCGPWFVRPTEVECIASRMFYEQELFLSNISDTNPMRSIIGRCVVMTLEEIKESECNAHLSCIPAVSLQQH